MDTLATMGVGRLFGPGSSTQDIVAYIRAWFATQHGADALTPLPPPREPKSFVPAGSASRPKTAKPARAAGKKRTASAARGPTRRSKKSTKPTRPVRAAKKKSARGR
jgi:hypothetical protein